MGRKSQLAIALMVAMVIAACGSHFLAKWLSLKTTAGQKFIIGKPDGKSSAFLAGSSLATYGISWDDIAAQQDVAISVWGIAGSSPFEWEQFQPKAPDARVSYIVVSAYDLDEGMICDFRADLVPVGQAIKTLADAHTDWAYMKRDISQYPMTWLRTLFPTLGRSRGIMGDLRIKLGKLVKSSRPEKSEGAAGPRLQFGKTAVVDEYALEKISEWPKSKLTGKVAAMRASYQTSQSFNGPKELAFDRMLEYAEQRGRAIVVVLPVSQSYAKEFLSSKSAHDFEDALAERQKKNPRVQWVRLDQMQGMTADDNFCDLVHMNLNGQKRATDLFLEWLKQTAQNTNQTSLSAAQH